MRLVADSLTQPAGTVRVSSCLAKAGFVSDDATTPEGFGKSAAAGEAKPQARARRSCRISSQDDTAHRRLSWSRVSANSSALSASPREKITTQLTVRGFKARSTGGVVTEPLCQPSEFMKKRVTGNGKS